MYFLSVSLHEANERSWAQCIPIIKGRDHESYKDWTGNNGVVMCQCICSANMHLYVSLGKALTHPGTGG